MDSSMGKMCLGKDVIEIFTDRNEGSGDWDSLEYKDTVGSGRKKESEALVFHKMYTEEDSDRYIAQCFVNGLYASDGEINLEKNDNLISNDYAVKLCLEYEVRKGKKLVKKELMVLLRGEIYFVQFIINPEEDEFEPGLIFGRSFLRSANAIVNFGEGTITIQPDFDPFLLSSDEEGKPNLDDLETLLDFDFDEVPQTETDLPPMVCKMGKGSRNKKKVMENIMYFNNGAGPSSSIGIPLTQEEAEKRALAHNISMRYEILEEVRPVIETLAYNDKYRKLLDEIWADKVRLDGMIKPKEEKAMAKMKGHMLKEKKDPGAFIFPIRLEGRINENALADIGSDTNAMPYRIYEQLGRDDIMKEDRNIIMINYTEAEVTGRLTGMHPSWWVMDSLIRLEATLTFQTGYLLLLMDILVKPLEQLNQKKIRIVRATGYEKIQRNELWLLIMFEDRHQNGYANVAWVIAKWMKRKGAGSQKDDQICCGQFISKIARKRRVLTEETIRSMSAPVYYRDLDSTTLRELIDSEDRLIPEIPVDDIPRVAAQRAPRVQRASMQDLYERMGIMEIRQEAIERMEYRHAYHWDRYQGVFEHMVGVYSVLFQSAYNPPGYAQPQYDQCFQ
ncbi:hypothetical protein Tco_1364733 [Tanacetum coccineum]